MIYVLDNIPSIKIILKEAFKIIIRKPYTLKGKQRSGDIIWSKTVPWLINYQMFKAFLCDCMHSEILCTINLIFFITISLCTPQDAKYGFKVWSFSENCWAISYPMPIFIQGLKPSVMNPYVDVKSVTRHYLWY